MDERERHQIRRRIENWRDAGDFLEKERRERLRAMTDDECRRVIAQLLATPVPVSPERGSGLVEQQKIFRRAG